VSPYPKSDGVELSVVVAGLERLDEPAPFLSALQSTVAATGASYEILTAPAGEIGVALRDAFSRARGRYVITVDPDVAPPMAFVRDLWDQREEGEIVIASRYAPGGHSETTRAREWGSRLLNAAVRRGLSLEARDCSSALRLYRRDVLEAIVFHARGYDFLQEVLVRAHAAGWRIREIPLRYTPNPRVRKAHAKLTIAAARTLWGLWKLRNSIAAADYDCRAHDSVIPLQRYWQRSRYGHITELIAGAGAVLDAGCGSSHIIGALPPGSVALDVLANKLRFARRFRRPLVRGSIFALPFADESFPCVLSSQVIEHIPMAPSPIDELCRVLAPGGRLVLGTPDYDRAEWVYIEKLYGFFAPGGYADEHISHYTRAGLLEEFARRGYRHLETRYILRGELILSFEKPGRSS
jgi:dolichol-phosphate mannosyltransferase